MSNDYIFFGCVIDGEKKMAKIAINGDRPTVTKEMVNAMIDNGCINTQKVGTKTTLCHYTLENGFEMVETSACVDPANFNQAIGEEICREHVVDKIWNLMGFLMQSCVGKMVKKVDE